MDLLLGHLVGDYLLQSSWMVKNKADNTDVGWLACFIHCIIYTATIQLFTGIHNPYWLIFAVFLQHFLIDKFSLAEYYLTLIRGRSIRNFYKNKERDFSESSRIISGGFTTLVYAVVDNTFHLLIMWYGLKLI